jgi:hypothetical protein
MTLEIDVWRAANLMLRRCGERALEGLAIGVITGAGDRGRQGDRAARCPQLDRPRSWRPPTGFTPGAHAGGLLQVNSNPHVRTLLQDG